MIIPIPLPQHQHTFCQRRRFDQDCPGLRQVEMNKMKSVRWVWHTPVSKRVHVGQADFILFISTWRRPGQSWSKRRLWQKVCWCWGRGIGIVPLMLTLCVKTFWSTLQSRWTITLFSVQLEFFILLACDPCYSLKLLRVSYWRVVRINACVCALRSLPLYSSRTDACVALFFNPAIRATALKLGSQTEVCNWTPIPLSRWFSTP